MSRYNLLDEPWIPVLIDESGETEKVSLTELYENAHEYIGLACDSKTQEFAILRLLLAVLHTVFSRFDSEGKVYPDIVLDEKFLQSQKVQSGRKEKLFGDKLHLTWMGLWEKGSFPSIVSEYLEKWRDRFYLFDEEYPFYQVTAEDIGPEKITKEKASPVFGRDINRSISESSNKISLFSPKSSSNNNKNILEDDEIARWLITYQNFSGISDKTNFKKDPRVSTSNGWLYNLGGLYIEGKNFFETLLYNLVLVDENGCFVNVQKPCWEFKSEDIIDKSLNGREPDNLAELYTNWAKAIFIDPNCQHGDAFVMNVVKLPKLKIIEFFLEPMTLWAFRPRGKYKDHKTPLQHQPNQAMWRSFGNIAIGQMFSDSGDHLNSHTPEIIKWYKKITSDLPPQKIKICSISLIPKDTNSYVPANEVTDSLYMEDIAIKDDTEQGWTLRIINSVEETIIAISKIYKSFLYDIQQIRNIDSNTFVSQQVEEMYFIIDEPFRDWLSSINYDDDKDQMIFEWRKTLKGLILKQAEKFMVGASMRDYKGVEGEKGVKNIATAYSKFHALLNKNLVVKEEGNDR